MYDLYSKLKKYSLEDAVNFEERDRQFLALKNLYQNKLFDDKNYLFLTIANALICYQLSGKGEVYWEEFDTALQGKQINNFLDIKIFFKDFLSTSKNNKRFSKVKLNRINKLEKFYITFLQSTEIYYRDMTLLRRDLASTMNQQEEAKTVVFAVKMFSYSARNVFDYLEYFSKDLMLPIDSRLEKLYQRHNGDSKREIKEFYIELSKKLDIPLLHLDAVLWVNYQDLIK